MRTDKGTTDALTSQMPLFGIPTSTVFTEDVDRFSLAFQEGLRSLPWISVYDHKKRPLEQVRVTFVYSKTPNGGGTIHAVTSETTYSKDRSDSDEGFRVSYVWKEEEQVDLQSGLIVMCLVVCIAAMIVMIQSCTGSGMDLGHQGDENSGLSSYEQAYGQQSATISSGMPKWD